MSGAVERHKPEAPETLAWSLCSASPAIPVYGAAARPSHPALPTSDNGPLPLTDPIPTPVTRPPLAKGLAVFDFDGTLVRGDSLMPFLSRVVGPVGLGARVVLAAVAAALVSSRSGGGEDFKTRFKRGVIRRCLAGVPVARAHAAAAAMGDWPRWHAPLRDALLDHHRRGHRVVIATGALAIYMRPLLAAAQLPVDDLLATELEDNEGTLTGELRGGNCVRAEKARLLADWMGRHRLNTPSWGYGNAPSDLPFLAMMDHPTVVKTQR